MAARGLIKMRRTPEQLIDVTVQPIVFTVMFTYIFGGAIAGSVADYLPFLLPGILVQTVITTSVVTGVQLREDMDKGVFDRFRSLPIARVAPLAGALLGYLIFTVLLGFGDTDIFDWGGFLSALIGAFIVLPLAGLMMKRSNAERYPRD